MIISSAIDNYRFTLMMIIIFISLGVTSFITMPRSEDPQLSFPINYITVVYPGTGTGDMEQMVADPLEEVINEIDDLKEIRTEIRDGLVTLRVEFEYGSDPDKKYDDLVAAITVIKDKLPSNLARLDIKKLSPSDVNVLQIALVSETATYRELRLHAERLEKMLERTDGIKRSDTWAIPEQQVQITLNFEKIHHLGIALSDIYRALQGEARSLSGGHVNVSSRRFTVRTSGKYLDLQSIKNIHILSIQGKSIFIRDIANVDFTDSELSYIARFNGSRCVFITAMQNERTNIYNVIEKVNQQLVSFHQSLPQNIKAEVVLDKSINVTKRLGFFFISLLQGLAFVGLVVLLFLGFKSMTIIVATIPISILIAFALLDQTGFGIQQLSIVGLIIALGLLVDNSIVVSENISRLIDEGLAVSDAVREGTIQVSWAVTSGTITTILAFFPILAMQTSAGSFIRSLPVIVIYILISSLFIALLFTPILFLWIHKLRVKNQQQINTNVKTGKVKTNKVLKLVEGPYYWLLTKSIQYSKIFIILILLGFFSSLSLFKSVGVSFFPKAENNQLMINIKLPESSSIMQTTEVTDQVEEILDGYDIIKSYATNIGQGNPRIYYSETPPSEMANRAQIFVQVNARNSHHFRETVIMLNQVFDNFIGGEVVIKEFQQGKPIEAPIIVRLFGNDFDILRKVSKDIEELVINTAGTKNIDNPIGDNKLDIQVNIDRDRAALLNIPIANIDTAVRMGLVGTHIGYYRDSYGDDFSIVVKLAKQGGANISDFEKIMVENLRGELVPLMQVVKLELTSVAGHIQHYDSQRSSKITSDVNEGENIERVTQEISKKLKTYTFPSGVVYKLGGERKSRNEAFRGFVKAIIISLLGIFTVLVFQFRSFVQPLIIFAAIPFSISGAILALYLTGYTFSFMAFLGIVGLIGIVINNAIILIDTANFNFRQTNDRYTACLQATKNRLRPILLTTLTTVASLFPIALLGSLTWSPLAWVIIGGLLMSMLISLLLVPVLYLMFSTNHIVVPE